MKKNVTKEAISDNELVYDEDPFNDSIENDVFNADDHYQSLSSRTITNMDLTLLAQKRRQQLASEGFEDSLVDVSTRATPLGNYWRKLIRSFENISPFVTAAQKYVKQDRLLHLSQEQKCIVAHVSGKELYEVQLQFHDLDDWQSMIQAQALDQEWLEPSSLDSQSRLLNLFQGILPNESNFSWSCTCSEWSDICEHVGATLLSLGYHFDRQPYALLTLRGINQQDFFDLTNNPSLPTQSSFDPRKLQQLFNVEFASETV